MIDNLQSISARPVSGMAPSWIGSSEKEKTPQIQGDTLDLSPEAEAQLRKLKQRDAEVRAHEKAHLTAAGGNAVGGAHYEYQTGPDGKQYAIGGHVDISLSDVEGNPEESEDNAREVRRAALAPGQPSGQDRAVAAQASTLEAQAKTEKLEENSEENSSASGRKNAEVSIWESIEKNIAADQHPEGSAQMRKAIGIYNEIAMAGAMKTAYADEIPGLSMSV